MWAGEIVHGRQNVKYDKNSVFLIGLAATVQMWGGAKDQAEYEPCGVGISPIKDVLSIEKVCLFRYPDERQSSGY